MALPVKTGLPFGMVLPDGYSIQWRAIDPTTGDDVAGVVVSQIAIQGDPQNTEPDVKLEKVYEMPGLTSV